jgi:APA family basic amino acid/polyamine antiporter
MARDGLFFRHTGQLNSARVPAWGLALQCVWSCLLVLPRTAKPGYGSIATEVGVAAGPGAFHAFSQEPKVEYGNLYGALLDYVITAALLFYILTIVGIFVLRYRRPDAPRPYRAFGYPVIPVLYVLGAAALIGFLVAYKSETTWPGLILVLLGVPVYYIWKIRSPRTTAPPT